ncbi:MAG: winged helix-turn-helix domain-containing protein [Candidatus Bathyarchaeia archaeon]|nr:winged helix-turn-helix transcriptional regulator [Candidatus Bathyarchaeota archaeon]
MPKERYHPNAYLREFRNVKTGLKARTAILDFLEKTSASTREISKTTGLPYNVVLHHLKLLEIKGIVQRKNSRPATWTLTGFGQKRLG